MKAGYPHTPLFGYPYPVNVYTCAYQFPHSRSKFRTPDMVW